MLLKGAELLRVRCPTQEKPKLHAAGAGTIRLACAQMPRVDVTKEEESPEQGVPSCSTRRPGSSPYSLPSARRSNEWPACRGYTCEVASSAQARFLVRKDKSSVVTGLVDDIAPLLVIS